VVQFWMLFIFSELTPVGGLGESVKNAGGESVTIISTSGDVESESAVVGPKYFVRSPPTLNFKLAPQGHCQCFLTVYSLS